MGFLCLVGKVWTGKSFNGKALLFKPWNAGSGIQASEIERRLFLLPFLHSRQSRGVLKGQPWHFGITLFLREIEGTTQHRQTLRCRYSGGVGAQSGFQ
ncbi:hypothetical protein NC652_023150 [Populus alba x Populus x berolinensis]|nr:hypothetical protein NC652_023150 [Populus alba x Populus x berolinensis]